MAKALQVKPKCSNFQEPSQTPTTSRSELEWCGGVLHPRDQAWDKLGGIFHHRIVL
jgi:hypothetical protein